MEQERMHPPENCVAIYVYPWPCWQVLLFSYLSLDTNEYRGLSLQCGATSVRKMHSAFFICL